MPYLSNGLPWCVCGYVCVRTHSLTHTHASVLLMEICYLQLKQMSVFYLKFIAHVIYKIKSIKKKIKLIYEDSTL